MATATKTANSVTKALKNAYLLIATPISVYAGYEGYKHSDSYLAKYPDPPNKSWCFMPERLQQPAYTAVVRSAWTVGSAGGGFFFPITIPLYLHHVQTSTQEPSQVQQETRKMKSELEE